MFENAFVTNSICRPSRATVLTGKYAPGHGVYHNGSPFDPDQMTFPKRLQKAGYQTALFGKWHLGTDPRGSDAYEILRGQRPYYNPVMRTPYGSVKHTGYTTKIIANETLDRLKNRREKDRPFMVMYQNKAPHRDWKPGPDQLQLFDNVQIPEPDTLFDNYEGRASPAKNQAMQISEHLYGGDLKLNGVPPAPQFHTGRRLEKCLRPEKPSVSRGKSSRQKTGKMEIPAVRQRLPPVRKRYRRSA